MELQETVNRIREEANKEKKTIYRKERLFFEILQGTEFPGSEVEDKGFVDYNGFSYKNNLYTLILENGEKEDFKLEIFTE